MDILSPQSSKDNFKIRDMIFFFNLKKHILYESHCLYSYYWTVEHFIMDVH